MLYFLDLPSQAKVFVYNLVHQNVTGCPILLLAVAAVWPQPIFKFNYQGKATPFYLLDYVTLIEIFQIGDRKTKMIW